jgi:hypothetical protein
MPKRRLSPVTTAALVPTSAPVSAATRPGLLRIRFRSIPKPTVIKKKPSKIPLKGLISASI